MLDTLEGPEGIDSTEELVTDKPFDVIEEGDATILASLV